MVLERIQDMLQSCDTDWPVFPPTILYKEDWLLRLVMDWFSSHNVPNHALTFCPQVRWFSEALLPSAFLATHRGDRLAEGWTHADGVIGHFEIGNVGKADLALLTDATQLVVIEAKMFAGLSAGVTRARYFDQAARTVACIAEVLHLAGRDPSLLSTLGFYVLAPEDPREDGPFHAEMNKESIEGKVQRRVTEWVEEHGDDKDQWCNDWFQPTLQRAAVDVLSWEAVIGTIASHDAESGDSLKRFYDRCVEFNR